MDIIHDANLKHELFHDRDKLNKYYRRICLVTLILWIGLTTLTAFLFSFDDGDTTGWSKIFTNSSERTCSWVNCSIPTDKFSGDRVELFEFIVVGLFASATMFDLISIMELRNEYSIRLAPYICCFVIHLISTLTHLALSMGYGFPYVSIWGRVNHCIRWAQWISLVPMLIVLRHSIDIKNSEDKRDMIVSAVIGALSTVLGGLSSLMNDVNHAVPLLIVSCVLFSNNFWDFKKAYTRYAELSIELQKEVMSLKENRKKKSLSMASSSSAYSSCDGSPKEETQRKGLELDDMSVYQNAERMEESLRYISKNQSVVLSLKLSIYSTFAWTIIVIVYMLGVFDLITNETELILQAVADVLSKVIWTNLVCSSYSSILTNEDLLEQILIVDNKSRASLTQALRFICHEMAGPLHTISMSLSLIGEDEEVSRSSGLSEARSKRSFTSDDSASVLHLAKESCDRMKQVLDEISSMRILVSINQDTENLTLSGFGYQDILKELIENVYCVARFKNVKLACTFKSGFPITIISMLPKLKQVVSVVLLSAVENSLDGNTVDIVIESTEELSDSDHYALKLNPSFEVFSNYMGGEQNVYKRSVKSRLTITTKYNMTTGSFENRKSAADSWDTLVPGGVKFGQERSQVIYLNIVKEVAKQYLFGSVETEYSKDGTLVITVDAVFGAETDVEKMAEVNLEFDFEDDESIIDPLEGMDLPLLELDLDEIDDNSPLDETGVTTLGKLTKLPTSEELLPTFTAPQRDTDYVYTALVVDDMLSNRKLGGMIMKKLGYSVRTANHGIECIRQIYDAKTADEIVASGCLDDYDMWKSYESKHSDPKEFDVIIMDNCMPVCTGEQASRLLRQLGYKGLIIGLTGNMLDSDITAFIVAGCNRVLTKPLQKQKLKDHLKGFNVLPVQLDE